MMPRGGFLLGLILVALVIGGPICGIIALVKVRKLVEKLRGLEDQLGSLRYALKKEQQPTPPPEKEIPAEKPPAALEVAAPPEIPPSKPATVIPPGAPTPCEEEKMVPPLLQQPRASLEMKLGTKWLNWVGIVMLLVGVGFFLKYAYDNAWIGPKGRLAIGTLFGIASIALGERFRRRHWDILFQVLTGGGLAAFCLCVFFSFQVYHLSDQASSMALAILVTALAVVMADYDLAKAVRGVDQLTLPVLDPGPAVFLAPKEKMVPWSERHGSVILVVLIVAVGLMLVLIVKNLRKLPTKQQE